VEEEGTEVLYRFEVGDVGSESEARGEKQASKVDETTKGKREMSETSRGSNTADRPCHVKGAVSRVIPFKGSQRGRGIATSQSPAFVSSN
jgi:hypothetical protein